MESVIVESKVKRKKRSSPNELAEKLIAFLDGQRRLGTESYPMELRRLVTLSGEDPSSSLVKKTVNGNSRTAFGKRILVACKSRGEKGKLIFDSPVCFVDDITMLAESESLLKFAFKVSCGGKARMFTPADLKSGLRSAHSLPDLFASALKEKMAEENLPAWVGWLPHTRTQYLFRLDDIQHSRGQTNGSNEVASTMSSKVEGFEADFAAAFDALDREKGFKNFLKLSDLRRALAGYDRASFDDGITRLCRLGQFALESSDGNFVALTSEEQDAGIREGGSNLVYCSRR